jgi:hypothetical protein
MTNLRELSRLALPVVAGALAGVLAGLVWTLAQPERHRAETRLLIRGPAVTGAGPAVRALAESSVLEENVRQTLRLQRPPNVRAANEEGRILRLEVEAGSAERARQIDAEAAVVLRQLVLARFRPARLETSIFDPAHAVEQTSPTPARNFLVSGVAGIVLGLAAAGALASRARKERTAVGDLAAEQRLQKRVDEVTTRELALARRAGELAGREATLEKRARELAVDEERVRELEAAARAEPPVAASPPAEPSERSYPAHEAEARAGAWALSELERAVEERSDVSSEQKEEWRAYLYFLREHASADGTLPRSFDGLIADVFERAF